MNKPLRKLLGGLLTAFTRSDHNPDTHSGENAVQGLPEAPCGNSEEHHYWLGEGWSCPVCAKQQRLREEAAEEDRILRKLAKLIAEEMRHDNVDKRDPD